MSYLTKISKIITPIRYFVTGFFHLYFNKFSFANSKSEKGFHLASPIILLTFQVLDNWDNWKKAFQVWSNKFGLEKVKARINKGVFVSLQVHKVMHKVISNKHGEKFHADIKLWKKIIREVLIQAWWGAAAILAKRDRWHLAIKINYNYSYNI